MPSDPSVRCRLVCAHVNTVTPGTGSFSNGDAPAAGILRWFPILSHQCPESIVPLAERDPAHRDTRDLEPHALRLLECVQRELAGRRPGPLKPEECFELDAARRIALDTLICLGGNAHAKAVQAAVSQGPPLAICTGASSPRPVPTIAGELGYTAQGCRTVFEDAPTKGKMWPGWCPDSGSKRNPRRDQAHALSVRIAEDVSVRTR